MNDVRKRGVIAMQNQHELLEDLRVQLLCNCISDMRFEPHITAVKNVLAKQDLSKYPLHELEDVAEYFYGVNLKFDDHSQAEAFFRK